MQRRPHFLLLRRPVPGPLLGILGLTSGVGALLHMIDYNILIGKIIRDVFTNEQKTVLVFLTDDNLQYEYRLGNGISFAKVAKLNLLLAGQPITRAFAADGAIDLYFEQWFLTVPCRVTFVPKMVTEKHYPVLSNADGKYALGEEMFAIKSLLLLSPVEKVTKLTSDYDMMSGNLLRE
jgi:hypothetical protein